MTFYDQVLRELLAALGAAMFFGNIYALLRRRADARQAAAERAAAASRGSRAKGSKRGPKGAPRGVPAATATGELTQAPVMRTVVYVALGFVMMVAGIASLAAG